MSFITLQRKYFLRAFLWHLLRKKFSHLGVKIILSISVLHKRETTKKIFFGSPFACPLSSVSLSHPKMCSEKSRYEERGPKIPSHQKCSDLRCRFWYVCFSAPPPNSFPKLGKMIRFLILTDNYCWRGLLRGRKRYDWLGPISQGMKVYTSNNGILRYCCKIMFDVCHKKILGDVLALYSALVTSCRTNFERRWIN